jgi:hypothetical protein
MPLLFLTLLLKVSTVEECDATGAAIKTSARLKKNNSGIKIAAKNITEKIAKAAFSKILRYNKRYNLRYL